MPLIGGGTQGAWSPLPNACLGLAGPWTALLHRVGMTSQQPPDRLDRAPRSPSWFSGRTRIITAVSIVAVGLAGATAVSANIGILDSASDSPVGDAAVTGDLATPPTQVVDVYLPSTAGPGTTSPVTTVPAAATPTSGLPTTTLPGGAPGGPAVQEFAVDAAGTVTVAAADGALRLERVVPAAGWTWTLAQSDPTALQVTMTDGARTFQFAASLAADGTVAAGVTEPIVVAAPAGTGPSAGYDDDHDDDHEDEGEGHEDEEHEDHDEYEGGEDDD